LDIVDLTLENVPGSATEVVLEVDTRHYQNGQTVNGQSYVLAGAITVDAECVCTGFGQITPPADITDRLVFSLLNESVACLREQIVEDADLLDAGIVFGTGFAPFRGGPMNHINSVGVEKQLERLEQLKQSQGDRFQPDSGWDSLPKV
jgi:hypothetical protein